MQCPEPPALLSLHPWLRVLSQLLFYYQICWWYCGSGPHFQQWWDRILGWGREISWCQDNCLSLNVSKTKELIMDFRKRQQRPYTPLMISGIPVERVSSFKYLGVNLSEDLTWTSHIQTRVKKARQQLYNNGLTSNPENFLFRGHRKCTDSVSVSSQCGASQCGMETAPVRTAKLCRELWALLSASQALFSPLCRTFTSNTAKAELIKSSRTQITPATVSSFYWHLASASGAWWQKMRDWGGASSPRPSGS